MLSVDALQNLHLSDGLSPTIFLKPLVLGLGHLLFYSSCPWFYSMDSLGCCNVRIKNRIGNKRARHSLDIDGDACHRAQIVVNKFCESFEYHVEGLKCDLHSDFKWSADHR